MTIPKLHSHGRGDWTLLYALPKVLRICMRTLLPQLYITTSNPPVFFWETDSWPSCPKSDSGSKSATKRTKKHDRQWVIWLPSILRWGGALRSQMCTPSVWCCLSF